jgi:pyruvate formate lyase activating enzyme
MSESLTRKGTEMKEAMFYQKLDDSKVACFLCAQHCRIEPGKRGQCGVRENRDGTLLTLVYGKLIAQHVDPIEKKPLYHFYPGTRSYSIATVGCNFRCLFCQNADISQAPREYRTIFGQDTHPDSVVGQAQKSGCATISYTYTEPTIFMEYALDVARKAHDVGIKNVFVSNGYMTKEALDAIAPYLDAANVDLKAYTDHFYAEQCGAHLKPVLKTLEEMKRRGIWIEVTTLLIPTLNDSPAELRQLAGFLAELDPEIPWHISRFHPTYRLTDRSATPLQGLHIAREIGQEAGLHHVYTGNVPGDHGENTYCHKCKGVLIERFGFSIQQRALKEGKCRQCGTRLEGVGIG